MNLFDDNKVKEELDIYQALLETEDTNIPHITEFINITKIINNSKNPQILLDMINKYYDKGILSPLTLNGDEFKYIGRFDYINKRYEDIILDPDDEVVYLNAYKPDVKHIYDCKTNNELPLFPTCIDIENIKSPKIWITKGGAVTKDYIYRCALKPMTVKRGSYVPHEPIKIPCSAIILNDNDVLFTVDVRESKIKTLAEYYNIQWCVNKNYPKYDIRKFKKLNNGAS